MISLSLKPILWYLEYTSATSASASAAAADDDDDDSDAAN